MAEIRITQAQLDDIKQELTQLRTVETDKVIEKINEAKSFGDLSENSEYDAARDEQAKLAARINELENIVSNAVVIDESTLNSDIIDIGRKVKVFDETYNEELTIEIVSTEADPFNNKISDKSPIGKALLGSKEGDVLDIETPGGNVRMHVVEILK